MMAIQSACPAVAMVPVAGGDVEVSCPVVGKRDGNLISFTVEYCIGMIALPRSKLADIDQKRSHLNIRNSVVCISIRNAG